MNCDWRVLRVTNTYINTGIIKCNSQNYREADSQCDRQHSALFPRVYRTACSQVVTACSFTGVVHKKLKCWQTPTCWMCSVESGQRSVWKFMMHNSCTNNTEDLHTKGRNHCGCAFIVKHFIVLLVKVSCWNFKLPLPAEGNLQQSHTTKLAYL